MTSPPHRVERRPRSDGIRSRATILEAAGRLASVDGIDGISIARLAQEAGISKSGLFAHFGSKEELQLATIDAAAEIFDRQVVHPAQEAPPGLDRLEALAEHFLRYVETGVFPGGCFFVSAVSELGAHEGPVRTAAMAFSQRWVTLLAGEVAAAQAAGELDPKADPTQVAFELHAFMVLGNMQFVAGGRREVLDAGRNAVDTRLAALAKR